MTESQERVLWEAEFDPKVGNYWLLSGAWILAATIVGIPLVPLWFLLGRAVTDRYLRHLKCVLTDRTLRVSRGLFTRVEKTVPLDKITDLGLVQGPIMRYMDLEALSVETAGQSSQGALVKLIGVVETRKFRDAVLAQRDAVMATMSQEGRPAADADEVLLDIRDTLRRIEQRLPQGEGPG
jgi:putative membrane protein